MVLRIAQFFVTLSVLFLIGYLGWGAGSLSARLIAAGPWAVIGLLWFMLLRGDIPFLTRLVARQRMIDPSKPLVDVISAEGYIRRHSSSEYRVAWTDVKQAVETADFFLLIHTPGSAYAIPKDVLSQAQKEGARSIIRASLPIANYTIEPGASAA
jgi:hypothetical protein